MRTSRAFQIACRVSFPALILTTLLLTLFNGCITKQKTYHVGILCGFDLLTNITAGFKIKMTELGYQEGISIVYDIQNTDSEPQREDEILQKFINEKVDLVFTFPTTVSIKAKKALQETNIPLVFANANIENTNLVNSILEPGKNVTGVRYPGPDISLKRLEILLEIVPHAKRILLPYNRSLTLIASQLKILRLAAESAGITLFELPASNVRELETEIKKLASTKKLNIDAILIIPEPLAVSVQGFKILAKFAADHNIPLGGALSTVDEYNTIMSVSTDNDAVGKQAAVLVDRILKGTPAGSIPVVSAESNIQINNIVAKKLRIKIPDGLLKQADRVIR
jgi:putative tryptophan/tyrosine transport system substrate-binding protein